MEITASGNYFDYIAQELSRLRGMAENFSSRKLDKKESRLVSKTLKLVTDISKQNKKSEELLCFGYHVLARKK
jgi:hypothetical protein